MDAYTSFAQVYDELMDTFLMTNGYLISPACSMNTISPKVWLPSLVAERERSRKDLPPLAMI